MVSSSFWLKSRGLQLAVPPRARASSARGVADGDVDGADDSQRVAPLLRLGAPARGAETFLGDHDASGNGT